MRGRSTDSDPSWQKEPSLFFVTTVTTIVTEVSRVFGKPYRVVVAEGIYREVISIDRPVEIIGLGESRKVIIESMSDNVITIQADQSRIANVTVRHVGDCCSGIKVTNGRVVIERCDVTSSGLSCISIQGGAWPSIHHNRIHGGNQEGIYIGL